jgi:Putative beta-barrel porin-2, OmpL-like. bbp2
VNPFTGLAQGVSAYGIAQYATYKIDDIFKIGGRLEIFRDNNNFFVAGFPGYFDNVNAQHGFAAPSVIVAGPQNRGTTYLSLTTGVTITPEVPKNPYIANVILRPELRWDTTLNDTTPFAGGTKRSTVTFGFDAIVPFTLK